MSITTILIILLVIALVTTIPTWNYSRSWGYGPTGFISIILIVLLILFLTGHIHI